MEASPGPRLLTEPAEGAPEPLTTPDEFASAAKRLAGGRGPFAIDTERASGYRYDDRAFLIQVRRRGAGTFLFAPEGHRKELTSALRPVLGQADWVMHAAASDLPSLAWLGLYPGRLFDTELAGRLAGFDRVNLGALCAEVLGIGLAKGHGAEDWSTWPLPHDWLAYAALDVELLLELAEAMAEILDAQGKIEWASQEFDHIRDVHAGITAPKKRTWRDTKGLARLKSARQLGVAKQLWVWREDLARRRDLSPHQIVPSKVLLSIAYDCPTSKRRLRMVEGAWRIDPRLLDAVLSTVRSAVSADPASWPKRTSRKQVVPDRSTWAKKYPESWATYRRAKAAVTALSTQLHVPAENLIEPKIIKSVVWKATEEGSVSPTTVGVTDALEATSARPWQVGLLSPVIAASLQGRNEA